MKIRVQPEHVRREAMAEYARLQIFKLKVAIVLGLLVWLLKGAPLW